MKTRILVLTSSGGYAHNAAAIAFKEWAEYFLSDAVEVKIEYLLENSNEVYSKLVDFYNFIQRNMPWFHHIYWNILEYQELLHDPEKLFVGKDYYINLLKSFQPALILCTHGHINRGYFDLAKQILGDKLRCVTCCTELAGGYGFTRNWVNPKADIFWAQTQEVAGQAIAMGMPSERVVILGHLLHRSFYEPPLTEAEKKVFLREELNLNPDKFTLLLGTGGAGANNHISFLKKLIHLQDRISIIALCGKNEKTQQEIINWSNQYPDFQISALPFTDKMSKLLQVSSAVVARPGARTSSEALHIGCPMIFNGIGSIMPQELLAVRYFNQRNIGFTITNAFQLLRIIENWLEQPEIYQQLRQKMREYKIITDPQKVINTIV
jgi:processive 1,2-diacylglycerol beta-glucosyltransferase